MHKILFVQEEVQNSKVAESFIQAFQERGLPIRRIASAEDLPSGFSQKEALFLTRRKGGFVNPCPCTPKAVCCAYHNINLVEGCPFTCNYCALDVYLNFPATRVFTNLEDFEEELKKYVEKRQEIRIGTGELSDSLVWEPYFDYSGYLCRLFSAYPRVIMEFKTKSVFIERFLNRSPQPNVVISWSLNAPSQINHEEKNTPSLTQRLEAAQTLAKRGYRVGFHFDPIFHYPGWQEEYSEVTEALNRLFAPHEIAWISLGVIRFHPELKETLYQRVSSIMRMELFPSHTDGKMRLFYDLRKEIFDFFQSRLKPFQTQLYLCMEPDFMWQDLDLSEKNLNRRLYQNCLK